MERKKASDFAPGVLDLFDRYVHGAISRRDFLDRAAKFAVGGFLAAAVPFYGAQPNAEDGARIKAPLLIHYAALDERINAGWPAHEAALRANSGLCVIPTFPCQRGTVIASHRPKAMAMTFRRASFRGRSTEAAAARLRTRRFPDRPTR